MLVTISDVLRTSDGSYVLFIRFQLSDARDHNGLGCARPILSLLDVLLGSRRRLLELERATEMVVAF